ncbi:MAG: RHS repeat-associated core domain-containing protein, partial [Leptospiraceae bacterium]
WSSFARYAYEPFGRVVKELSDMDADGDGIAYAGTFQFTGQEYEEETGLYNYKARLYDPDTGRFLQPDPVHTAQPGQDNWDRYAYVWNNPVNFTDSTGMSPENASPSKKTLEVSLLFSFALGGGVQGKDLRIALVMLIMGMGYNAEPAVMGWGHNYSGSGNYDPFGDFNDRDGWKNFVTMALVLQKEGSGDHDSMVAAVLLMMYLAKRLSPGPGTPGDRAGIVHDRAVPGSNGDVYWAGPKTDKAHMRASEDRFKVTWHNLFHPNSMKDRYEMAYQNSAWVEEMGLGATGRSFFAVYNYVYSNISDLVVYGLGAMIFGLDYMTRGVRNMGRRLSNWVNDRF